MMLDTLVFAGLVLAFVQVFKVAFNITSRWIPLVSLIVGTVVFFIAYKTTPGMVITWEGLSQIFVAVLSAMGLYSGSKATVGQ